MAHGYFAAGVRGARAGDRLTVTGAEARHAVTVARLQTGETILLLDGEGSRVPARVLATAVDRFTAEATADASLMPEPSPRILLAQALAKGGRDEIAVQAAVELGVDGIVPWQAQRSVVRWNGAKAQKHHERWQAIVREAAKQSLRARVPSVSEPVVTKQLAATAAGMLILEPTATSALSEVTLPSEETITLVVGPEGGISPEERALLREAGAREVCLGENVLRTSTAGPAAIALLWTRLRRW